MKNAPEITIPRAVELPQVERVELPNGLPVHLIRTEGQQVARVSVVWTAGSAVQSKPFVASSTLNLLAEGSTRFSAHEIAEKLDFVGSYFDVNIDRDYAIATFCCLDKFFTPTLEMMAEVVLRPAFPESEVDLYRRKRMERLALERSKPSTKARELFSAALFGENHPYGISSPESDYMNLQRADIQQFYDQFYGAGNAFAVCSLSDDPAQREAVLALLSQIPVSKKVAEMANFEPAMIEKFRKIEIPKSVQSAIRIGRILFTRSHPDFVGMQVVATILGGYFGSRLTQNLREERGYTYGVMAAMVNLRSAGYLAIATEVAAEATDDAIAQIFNEIARLREDLVPADELENVRRAMLGEVMRIVDGPFGIVDVVIENIQVAGNAAPSSAAPSSAAPSNAAANAATDKVAINASAHAYINDFIGQIEAITPERIRELSRQYLAPESFTTVVVGLGGEQNFS